jgi:hypothetical protein
MIVIGLQAILCVSRGSQGVRAVNLLVTRFSGVVRCSP